MRNPSKRFYALWAMLLCAALLVSCAGGEEEDSRSYIMAAPPQSGQSTQYIPPQQPLQPDVALPLSVAARSLSGGYAGNTAGCYSISSYDDGSLSLQYVDYAAQTIQMLGGPPSLEGGKVGNIPDIWGSTTPLWAGEHLYLVKQRGTDEQLDAHGNAACAAILQLDAEGNVQNRYTFEPEYSFQLASAALFDGENLYFLLWRAGEEGAEYTMMKLSCADMQAEGLFSFEPGFEYSIDGFWEMGPLVTAGTALPPTDDAGFSEAWNNRQYTLYAYGMRSGTRRRLAAWPQGQPQTVQGNVFYYLNPDDLAVYALDADTEETRLVAEDFAPDTYVVAQMQAPMLDGRLRLQFSANQGRTIYNFAIQPETGDILSPKFASLGENITVCAESEEYFLVRSGEGWVRRELVDPRYDPALDANGDYNSKYVSVTEYSLIAKSDYWAGKRTLLPVEDLIYH